MHKIHNKLAPIVLFIYWRIPKKAIDSLLKNELAKKSDLFILSDGYSVKSPCLKEYNKDISFSWGWIMWKDRWDVIMDENIKNRISISERDNILDIMSLPNMLQKALK